MSQSQMKLDEVRKILLSLLVSRKGATSVPALDREYYDLEKKRIPYRQFGSPNLVDFLQSMPEYFTIEYRNGNHYVRGISEKSKHVSLLVERQKPKRVPLTKSISRQVKISPDKLFLVMQYIKKNPNGVTLQNAALYAKQMNPSVNITPQDLWKQLGELSHQLSLSGNMIYPISSCNNVAQQPEERHSPNESPSDSGLPLIKQNICVAGEEDSDCVEYFSDDNDFALAEYAGNQRHEETSEFAANHGQYTSCKQTDTFNYNKNNDRENCAMMNSQSNTERKIADRSDMSQLINDKTKNRLKELMQKHPEGIWCADLPSIYLQEYKVHLNYSSLGFVSVREFTFHLPNIFYMTQVNKTDDFKLYSADKRPVVPKPDLDDRKQTWHNRHDEHKIMQAQFNDDDDNTAPIPSNVSSIITKNFAPNDVMNYNDSVGKISMSDLNTKPFLGVYVVEVFNPGFFWVHLRENKKIFYQMMEELHDFYECNKSTYNIAKIALKKDMNCACVYMAKWHRAIIKSVKPDFRVTVLFYDYGTLKTYAPEDVYYLHKKFSFLPAQAIPCGLYNVKPTCGERWKKSVTDQFIDKIADTLLCATIITIEPMHNSMMVILTDTSEEDDLHINEWLVNERLAQFGQMADAVDMASIMKYVVNNLNQLPTYCFAEENLMPDSYRKTTSTGEKYEVPLLSPGPTLSHYDNHQPQPVRPPPGFAPLSEQYVSSSFSTTNFHNGYSFANTPNVKVPSVNDVVTNPFLADQKLIPNDIAKEMYMSMWNENKKLQIKVINILYDLLENPSLAFKGQIRLNKILKVIEKFLSEQNNHFTATKTSSASNSTSEPTLNDAGPSTSYNINNETFVKQDLNANTSSMSNPFGMTSDDKSQSNAAFTYGSDGFAFTTNWNQSEVNPLTPIPPLTSSAPSTFTSHISSANTSQTFLPNTDQDDENALVTPVSSTVTTNANIFNNFSEFLDNMNIQFANMLKDTNPFKFPTDKMQIPEIQNEQTSHSYDADNASHFSTKSLQSHSKTKTANIHAMNNCFTPASHVSENYTPRIVYESGPVMYNTQKKQADADARQNICNNNLNDIQKGQSFELGQDKKPTSQLANDTSYVQRKVINQVTRDNSQVDEKYVPRASTYYTQVSQPIINVESTYCQQNGSVNNLLPQSWNQIEIPERRVKFSNIPLLNHNENAAFRNLARQDWNCDNGRKSMSQEMNEATNSNHIFKFNDHDEEIPMNIQTNSWNDTEYKSVQPMETININSFVFQKIDSVKGVTFIFNIEQDGWILTCEFIETFTNLKLQSCLLTMLEALNIQHIVFKEIRRAEYPLQFSQLDRYPLNVPRDSEKRIISINLISLQSALALLHRMKIVSREEIENAFKKNEFLDGSLLSTLWILIVTYRDLKRRIELCSNYI